MREGILRVLRVAAIVILGSWSRRRAPVARDASSGRPPSRPLSVCLFPEVQLAQLDQPNRIPNGYHPRVAGAG